MAKLQENKVEAASEKPVRILLVEDEARIARVLQLELQHEGYEVVISSDGQEGVELALVEGWDLIILDRMLPRLSGMQVLQRVRDQDPSVPILMLTAKDTIEEKVEGLDLGANDYVTKPFVYEELSARIRSLIRQTKAVQEGKANDSDALSIDGLTVDMEQRLTYRNGVPAELTPREFDLLVFMLQHQGEALSRERILAEVWGYDFAGDTNLVDVYIRYLRQKIDTGHKPKLIFTARGIGYGIREP